MLKGLYYTVRPAINKDAKELSKIRVQIDGETQNLDREKGEAFIDTREFWGPLIKSDTENKRKIFLVAVV